MDLMIDTQVDEKGGEGGGGLKTVNGREHGRQGGRGNKTHTI